MRALNFLISAALAALVAADDACHRPVDIVYVVDSSGSIGYRNWQLVKRFFADVTRRLDISPIQVRVGGVVFGHQAEAQWGLNDYTDVQGVLKAVAHMQYMKSTTNTAHGLETARSLFEWAPRKHSGEAGKLVILMTDGAPTVRVAETLDAADSLKKTGAKILALGITPWVDSGLLKELASPDSNTGEPMYIQVQDFNQLASQVMSVLNVVCSTEADASLPHRETSKPSGDHVGEEGKQPSKGEQQAAEPQEAVTAAEADNNQNTHDGNQQQNEQQREEEEEEEQAAVGCAAEGNVCKPATMTVKETIVQVLTYTVTARCDGTSSCARLTDSTTTKSTEFQGARPTDSAAQARKMGLGVSSDTVWWASVKACNC